MTSPEAGPPRRVRSRWRKALAGVAVALAVLLLAELALQGLGALTGRDLRFDPLPRSALPPVICDHDRDARILCPDAGDRYDRVRPVRFAFLPDRPRVTVIGESFVHGYSVPIEDAWPARLGERLGDRVEVLNFGRCGSYAGQLIEVLHAALEAETSVLVIAVGNNEHTMTTFYRGWAGRHPLAVYRLSATLGRLQLYGALYRLVGGDARLREQYELDDPGDRDGLDARILAARRRPPDLSRFDDGLADAGVTAALEREQRLKERVFRDHLDEMLALADDAGVPAVVCTLPADRTRGPALSGVHDGDEDVLRDLLRRLDSGTPEQRMARIDEGLRLDDRVARFHHERGMELLRQGRPDEAAEPLRRAASWDLVPDGTPEINAIIRDVARRRGVPLVDLEASFDAALRDPDRRFLDGIHVSAEGADDVADAVVAAVEPLLAE